MRELTREPGLDGLDVGAIRRRLAGEVLGTHVYVFSEVVSTNAALRDLADAGAREGTVVIAESQRRGRGRFGTEWFSPPGLNLHVSVLLRPNIAPSAAPIFSFIASLALTEAIWELGVPASVKWPNDVVVRGRKVAGARLDLGIVGDGVSYAVIGVGINANVLHADLARALGEAAADATSLREALGRPVDRNTLAAGFLNQLEKWLALYRARGADAVATAWRERDILTGRRVAIKNFDNAFVGRVAGIDANGFLVVDEEGHGRRTVISAAVRVLEEHGAA
jgi:BirA family transcriptional regulator, biotin operon repressor / biotin---[acetyl-CoA-carboxylase] ligase